MSETREQYHAGEQPEDTDQHTLALHIAQARRGLARAYSILVEIAQQSQQGENMSKPTDAHIIGYAVDLLNDGLLASLLPARLQVEFSLSPDRARRLAQQALQKRKEKAK